MTRRKAGAAILASAALAAAPMHEALPAGSCGFDPDEHRLPFYRRVAEARRC